ncbi:MAG: aminoglycoside phosphotransferase family protein [Prevotellaceae bacterium]|jgi:Ser/Thr protein kinase RdoA (MazF antagonist)|nr:aminoglycoside phosphotransferase family protein [Prevotellaceae bacterium]
MNKLQETASHFAPAGVVTDVRPFGNGLINDSYRVHTEGAAPDYLLQRINHHIFQNVEQLQENIAAVTAHIRRKLTDRGEQDIDRKVLTLIPAKDGKKYYFDGENYWRMLLFIPRSVSYEKVDPTYSRYAGLAFGDFQRMLADMPQTLGETIPDFHNMEFRLQQLRDAVRNDAAGRVLPMRAIIDEIERRATDMCRGEQLHREGRLPKRVCHCDTKVNNILFDESGELLCVVDLDTVMPNYIFSDYGDFLRTAANTGDEDDRNLSRVGFNMAIFRAFTEGYLTSARAFLTDIEIDHLPYAAALFPYMQCVRFLADYLNGDTYYKIQYPEHNAVRTRAQFALWQSAEAHAQAMRAYIESIL